MWGSRRLERLEERVERLELIERDSDSADWNAIQTRLERLELDAHQKQLEVLTALDKALHQLRSRTNVRTKREAQEDPEEPKAANGPPSTAHLSARFRRF